MGSACHSASFTTKASIVAMIADEPVMTPKNIARCQLNRHHWMKARFRSTLSCLQKPGGLFSDAIRRKLLYCEAKLRFLPTRCFVSLVAPLSKCRTSTTASNGFAPASLALASAGSCVGLSLPVWARRPSKVEGLPATLAAEEEALELTPQLFRWSRQRTVSSRGDISFCSSSCMASDPMATLFTWTMWSCFLTCKDGLAAFQSLTRPSPTSRTFSQSPSSVVTTIPCFPPGGSITWNSFGRCAFCEESMLSRLVTAGKDKPPPLDGTVLKEGLLLPSNSS
mmetsp:Transcript_22816/g.52825  ORF Transcript_22816/g.52825 Transcript_22816/m.52825 type:complete len:281 (-) Transcript_22816:2142-2984(-)